MITVHISVFCRFDAFNYVAKFSSDERVSEAPFHQKFCYYRYYRSRLANELNLCALQVSGLSKTQNASESRWLGLGSQQHLGCDLNTLQDHDMFISLSNEGLEQATHTYLSESCSQNDGQAQQANK